MSNEWCRQRIPKFLANPQADWLHETDEPADWTPVVLALAPDLAVRVGLLFAGLNGIPVPKQVGVSTTDAHALDDTANRILLSTRMGPETFFALLDARSGGPGPINNEGEVEIAVLTATENLARLQDLADGGGGVRLLEIGAPTAIDVFGLPTEAWLESGDSETAHLSETKAMIAIIDDGIAFANERFRSTPAATRLETFWAMDKPSPGATHPGRTQPGVWKKEEIDGLLAEFDSDEEAIYRATGLLDPSNDRRQPLWYSQTHGTHVLDIAAGFDPEDDDSKAYPILAVQLPSHVVQETSGSSTAFWLKMALDRILWEAVDLGRSIVAANKVGMVMPPPLLLNFSFGVFAGPKDGSSLVERAISIFIANYRSATGGGECHVILPASNSFHSRTCAKAVLEATGSSHQLDWRVQPDDRSASFVHFWLPSPGDEIQGVAVSLEPPSGGPAIVVPSLLGYSVDWVKDGTLRARLYHQKVEWRGQQREWIVIAIRPTEDEDSHDDLVPAGLWRIRIENLAMDSGSEVDVTIQRDDSIRDHRRRGRQSYFDHDCYQRFHEVSGRPFEEDDPDCPIRRAGTLSAYAGACERISPLGPAHCDPIVVGGYNWSLGNAAIYSASGPVNAHRLGPTLATMSDTSPALTGVLATGTHSNSVVQQRGTSLAAPAFLRALLQEFAAGGDLQTLLDKVAARETGVIYGPHGPYPTLTTGDARRLGIGRLKPPAPVAHRRRLEA